MSEDAAGAGSGATTIATSSPVRDTVVMGMDASNQAEEAFSWYMQHLHQDGNVIVLAHGMELPSVPTRESWDKQHSDGKKKREDLQDKYTERFKEKGITGKFISDFEKPGEFICDVAKRENATYIVMGTRGMGKIRRTVMGSVSDYVVHHACCPVVVCRKK